MSEHSLINNGIVVVYKDEGFSSHDVVNAVRTYTGEMRVGHAGTLDPCAKGVIVVGVGRAVTKTLAAIVGKEKEYIVRVKLGWRSTSDDLEGRKTRVEVSQMPSKEQIREALKSFEGTIDQIPPSFSALKVRGRRAYKAARSHKPLELAPRQVEVRQIELLGYKWPFADIRLVTGPGFYVRSLARDLGEKLGTGAYADSLERTRVGTFTKENAVRLCDLKRP